METSGRCQPPPTTYASTKTLLTRGKVTAIICLAVRLLILPRLTALRLMAVIPAVPSIHQSGHR